MSWIRKKRANSELEAWIVFLGTGSEEVSLTLAAVTGSRVEAEALLDQGLRVFPDRSNEIASYPYISDPKTKGPATRGINPSERRAVFVLATGEDWYEVLGSQEMCEERQRELLAEGRPEPKQFEVVTNVWMGEVGSDPRLTSG